jgi:hypothetical protein
MRSVKQAHVGPVHRGTHVVCACALVRGPGPLYVCCVMEVMAALLDAWRRQWKLGMGRHQAKKGKEEKSVKMR